LARRHPRQSARAPELSEIADRLSEHFETRCSVALGRRKGRITIEFATLEDLHRIVETIETGPDMNEDANVDLSTSRRSLGGPPA
jgi:ParB family chromosome partitioning protein